MQFEENRYQSFEVSRAHISVSPAILAETGLYFIGPGDRVKCFFCCVEISQWSEGDDEVIEHFRYEPSCALLNGLRTVNIPTEPGEFLV